MIFYASLVVWALGAGLAIVGRAPANASKTGVFAFAGLLLGAVATLMTGLLGLASMGGALGLTLGAALDRFNKGSKRNIGT